MPRLDVRICACRGLPDVQTFGTIDPYVMIAFEGKQWRTDVCENSENPEWDNAVFKFNCADADSSQLKFTVWNKNKISDDFLGGYNMSISNLTRGEVEDKWVLMQQCKGNAELHIRMKALDFGDLPEEEKEEPETAPVPPQQFQPQQPQVFHGFAQHTQPPQGWAPPPVPEHFEQPAPPTPSGWPQVGEFYSLQPRHAPHLRVDVPGEATEAGTQLGLWTANGNPSQRFRLDPRGEGWFALCYVKNDQMAIDNPAAGVPCHLYQISDDNENQIFRLEDKGGGFFVLHKKREPVVFDVSGWGDNDGAVFSSWEANGGANQEFRFLPSPM